ncbi:hypothetical protein L211DRAFT_590443 [Terfezia boudieri ATCC MYA-4762]|uniref:Zn(2)-C6 fungal-type domain-containing protein n=1 Tax=Terfezia boudieri ATCC MYA-4762 TaxID=1051890 RepID=A0A3N4LAB8_9PEZI|nr:hypothetical protein L211DRAFT_590443 [Terfezia boudieri ATCC MYA-4762]
MAPALDAFYTSTSSTATASPPSVSTDNDFDDASRNLKRTPKACDRCRHKKTKCTGDSPCQRCRLDNTVCSFTNRRPKEGPSFNPQVAQKDAAMSMLYKCIEVMNRQLLAARLGPYTDRSLADYAESEEFIIGIILDRFGISPMLDEFDNQPVYLPGQRGFNPENCAVEFPQHSGHGDAFEDESYSQSARFIFNPQSTLPHSIYSSRSDISQDVQMRDQGETARDFNLAIPALQRHHMYTRGATSYSRYIPSFTQWDGLCPIFGPRFKLKTKYDLIHVRNSTGPNGTHSPRTFTNSSAATYCSGSGDGANHYSMGFPFRCQYRRSRHISFGSLLC